MTKRFTCDILPSMADKEYLLHHEDEEDIEAVSRRCSSTLCARSSFFGGLVVGIVFCYLAVQLTNHLLGASNQCTRKLSFHSPALSALKDDDLHHERFDSRFYQPNAYRGPPNDAIDNAWDELTYPEGGLLRISEDEIQRLDVSEYAAKYTDEMGGGYIAGVEALHQLHCVNMLRKATYMDYYLPKMDEWRRKPDTMRAHLDHCIDMLRQRLMCNPDVGIFTYVWATGAKQVFPDFNTCRDYSKVLQWTRENTVHSQNVSDLVRAPGAIEKDTLP